MSALCFQKDGVFVEAGAYRHNRSSDTEWLERELNWRGLLIQPDPKDYLILRSYNRIGAHCIHACLSPTPYPKEVCMLDILVTVKVKPAYYMNHKGLIFSPHCSMFHLKQVF